MSNLPAAVQVLNFYSTIFADQLKRGRKTATIRLGDKSHKYRKNQAVLVTTELRVVVLDVARRQILDALDLYLVDHGIEDLLAR